MLGKSLVVQSYVVINKGCPLAITTEGTSHSLIRCGGSPGDAFEIVVQHDALRALVELGTDALQAIDTPTPGAATPGTPTPGTASSGTASSGTASSGTASSGTAAPGTASSGTVAPGAAAPGTATPGTATPASRPTPARPMS